MKYKLSSNEIADLFKYLNKCHYGAGGNCGSIALAVARILDNNVQFIICSNDFLEDKDDLTEQDYIDYEPNIYHIVLLVDGTMFDCTGKCSKEDLLNIAINEYGDYSPITVTFDYNDAKISKIIDYNTNISCFAEEYDEYITQYFNEKSAK